MTAVEACGSYRKYRVEKLNDDMGKHNECEYFVLDLTHDPLAREAALFYARSIMTTNGRLMADIAGSVRRIEQAAADELGVTPHLCPRCRAGRHFNCDCWPSCSCKWPRHTREREVS